MLPGGQARGLLEVDVRHDELVDDRTQPDHIAGLELRIVADRDQHVIDGLLHEFIWRDRSAGLRLRARWRGDPQRGARKRGGEQA